jgi:hypothetical protein
VVLPYLLYRPKVQKARSMTWATDIVTDLSSSLEKARRLLFIISITLRNIDRQSNDWRVEGYAFRDVATKNAAELIWCMLL